MTQQVFQQIEFASGQFNAATRTRNAASNEIHLQIQELENDSGFQPCSSQQCTHPGGQFCKHKRLNKVVIGAGVETGYTISNSISGSQQQNRNRKTPAPYSLQYVNSASARQHDIQHDQIDGLAVEHTIGLFTRPSNYHGMRLPAKSLAEGFRNLRFVLDYQDSRHSALSHDF